MRNEFIDELKSIAMESIGINVAVDAYAGSEVAEELITLDVIDANAVAMESYEEALFAEAFESQEVALESANLTFGEIAKFNGELGMEAVGNAIKRGAYGAQIQAKKLIQKIVKFIVSIFDYFTVADGKFKSYNKLLKKYKEKLNKINPSSRASEDRDDKEFTIRKWDNLGTMFTEFKDAANVTDLQALLTAANGSNAISLLKNKLSTMSDYNENNIDESLSEYKSKLKDELAELKDKYKDRDTVTGTFYDLKSDIMGWVDTAISDTSKDIKYKGDLKKIKTKVGKLNKDLKDNDSAEDIRFINKVATPVLTAIQKKATLTYKMVTSAYQGLLSDMAKLISGGTQVTGN